MASQVPVANWPPTTLAPFSQSLDTFHCQASALSSGSWKPCPAKSVLLLLHSLWCPVALPPSALQHPSEVLYTYLCAYMRKVCPTTSYQWDDNVIDLSKRDTFWERKRDALNNYSRTTKTGILGHLRHKLQKGKDYVCLLFTIMSPVLNIEFGAQ